MLPIASGGHIHPRCADDFIGARDAARPRVDSEPLRALYKRTVEAQGRPVAEEILRLCGVRVLDDLTPQQERDLRTAFEALLA